MSGDVITAIGVLLIAAGATTFGVCLAMLIPLNEWPVAVTVPLAEGQWITLDAAGTYTLRGDTGGSFTFVFLGLRYTLQTASGTEVLGFRPPRSRGPNGVP